MGTNKRIRTPLAVAVTLLTALALVLPVAVGLSAGAALAAEGDPLIWTDKDDYGPEETVTIFGSGFLTSAKVTIFIEAPNLSAATIYAWTDESGAFTAYYTLNGMEGTYTVTATDGTNTATTTFTEAPKPKIETYESSCTTKETNFIQGDTVCAKATNLNTGKYYKIEWLDPSDASVQATVYGTGVSSVDDSYTLASDAPVGEWKVQMFEGDSATGSWGGKKEAKFCVMHAFFSPTDDSWVDGKASEVGKNFGDKDTLHVRWQVSGEERITYLKFDLSGLPACTVIDSAILHVYRNKDTGVPSAYNTTDGWTEMGIKWNNQPGPGALVVDGTGTASPEKQWLSWNITSYAQSELAGDQTLSIVLKFKSIYPGSGDEKPYHSDLTSKEGECAERPWLEISYSPAQYNLTVGSDGCCPIEVSYNNSTANVSAGTSDNFTVACCTNVTLTAYDIAPCCEFDNWTGDVPGGTNTTTPITFHIDSSKNVTAHCSTLGPYTLTVISDGCCPITVGALGTVAAGESETFHDIPCCTNVTLTADDSDVYCDFVNWTGDVPGGTNTPNPITIHIDDDKSVTGHCEPIALPAAIGSIGDTVFYDNNGNGVQDPGEPGIAGVKVELYKDDGNGLFNPTGGTDDLIGTRTTGGNGVYLFADLDPWCDEGYWVLVLENTLPPGVTLTTGSNPIGFICLEEGMSYDGADFGYQPAAPVGGEAYPVDKLAILMQWITSVLGGLTAQ